MKSKQLGEVEEAECKSPRKKLKGHDEDLLNAPSVYQDGVKLKKKKKKGKGALQYDGEENIQESTELNAEHEAKSNEKKNGKGKSAEDVCEDAGDNKEENYSTNNENEAKESETSKKIFKESNLNKANEESGKKKSNKCKHDASFISYLNDESVNDSNCEKKRKFNEEDNSEVIRHEEIKKKEKLSEAESREDIGDNMKIESAVNEEKLKKNKKKSKHKNAAGDFLHKLKEKFSKKKKENLEESNDEEKTKKESKKVENGIDNVCFEDFNATEVNEISEQKISKKKTEKSKKENVGIENSRFEDSNDAKENSNVENPYEVKIKQKNKKKVTNKEEEGGSCAYENPNFSVNDNEEISENCKMTRYKHADFADDDSVGSVQLTEGISSSATHIRYHTGTSMWKKRSMLEKALLLLVGTLLFVVMVLAFLLSSADRIIRESKHKTQSLVPPSMDTTSPCLNETCIHIASDILESMDSNIDPCDDFYTYACNGWVKNNPIPDGKSTWSTFTKLEQKNQQVVKHVLEQPIDTLKSKAEQKAKLYYESCLDVNDTVETLGAQPMLELLHSLGGWNVTSNFDVKKWSFQNTLQLIQNVYNIGGLFAYSVGEDDRNSSRHVLQVDQSGLTLPTREHYLNKTEHEKILIAYLDYMTKVGILLGGEPNSTKEQMQAVIDFETKLANITTPNELRRDEEALYNLMSIAELQEKANFVDWRLFFDNAMRIVNKKITTKEQVVVYAPEYLGNLTLLIKEYNGTMEGRIILNNYLIWQTVKTFTGCLSKAFRDAQKGLRKALMGSEGGEEPQWRYCVADTNNVLGFAVGAIFVREVFQGDSKIHAEAMINDVRAAFKKNFKNLDWMDKETREAAEIKADAISDMIGYPDFIKDNKQLDERYNNLDVRRDTYFDNNINLNKYSLKKNLEKINEPVNKTTWSMSPSTVNAYYTPTKNQMVFPAGILQGPFYDPKYPGSLNYGGMGVVMGHELTHGFDDQGREFDKDGNLHQWWNNKTIEKFKSRTKCVSKQYSSYKLNGKNLNGNQTLGENIADNGGLKAAYHAYLEYMRDKPDPPPLPGLTNLSHKQLFFVAFAQVWCTAVSKEATTLQIEKDSHSPAKFRVIGSLTNMKEFSEEFKCKPGSKMNPKNKCEVW